MIGIHFSSEAYASHWGGAKPTQAYKKKTSRSGLYFNFLFFINWKRRCLEWVLKNTSYVVLLPKPNIPKSFTLTNKTSTHTPTWVSVLRLKASRIPTWESVRLKASRLTRPKVRQKRLGYLKLWFWLLIPIYRSWSSKIVNACTKYVIHLKNGN